MAKFKKPSRGNSMSDVESKIREQISGNDILLYMKGTPQMPQCGFSAQVVQALMACGEEFAFVNILENPDIRATLPKIANWPTFPQLYLKGELVGGCDIVCELHEDGELKDMVKEALS
jgi:monothiol glutaredoxin